MLFIVIFLLCFIQTDLQSSNTNESTFFIDNLPLDSGVRKSLDDEIGCLIYPDLEKKPSLLQYPPSESLLEDTTDLGNAVHMKRTKIIAEPYRYPGQAVLLTQVLFQNEEKKEVEVHFTSFLVHKNLAITATCNIYNPEFSHYQIKHMTCYLGKDCTRIAGDSMAEYILVPPEHTHQTHILKNFVFLVLKNNIGEGAGFLCPTVMEIPTEDILRCSMVGYGVPSIKLETEEKITDEQFLFRVHGKKSIKNSSFFIHTKDPQSHKGSCGSVLMHTVLDGEEVIKKYIGFIAKQFNIYTFP